MVIVKGSLPMKEHLKTEALEQVQAFAEEARSASGCLACEVYWQADAPATLVLWQQWQSTATLKSHFASDVMEQFLDQLTLLLDGTVDTLYFDVENDADYPLDGVSVAPASCVATDVVLH